MSIKVSICPYINNIAYSSAQHASDYLQDQIYHGCKSLPDIKVQQIPYPWHMHKSAPKEDIAKIWGMGFTLYGLLEDDRSVFDVGESDLIIVPLHHTMCNHQQEYYEYIKEIKRAFKCPVVAIDGWDQPDFSPETAKLVPYFKRELYNDRKDALPIFFGIPEEKFYHGWVEKKTDFSDMIPANFSWNHPHTNNYHKYKTEEEYYKQYQESYFGYSCKKGGWATGRQNEIIANRCLPYVTDVEDCPVNCLFRYPKQLCYDIKRMRGVYPGTIHPYNPERNTYIGDTRQIKCGEERGFIDHDIFDRDLYDEYVEEIFNYALENLTTKALAEYVLEKSL